MKFLSKTPAHPCATQIWYSIHRRRTLLDLAKTSNFCSIKMLFWGHTAETPPMEKVTIGHENTGTVVAMGSQVKGFQIGDPVGCLGCSYACCEFDRQMMYKTLCGLSDHATDDCEGCRIHNLFCEKGTGRLHGFTTHGHFAEFSVSDYRNAMVLPAGMDLISAAPLFCAGVTGS